MANKRREERIEEDADGVVSDGEIVPTSQKADDAGIFNGKPKAG